LLISKSGSYEKMQKIIQKRLENALIMIGRGQRFFGGRRAVVVSTMKRMIVTSSKAKVKYQQKLQTVCNGTKLALLEKH